MPKTQVARVWRKKSREVECRDQGGRVECDEIGQEGRVSEAYQLPLQVPLEATETDWMITSEKEFIERRLGTIARGRYGRMTRERGWHLNTVNATSLARTGHRTLHWMATRLLQPVTRTIL